MMNDPILPHGDVSERTGVGPGHPTSRLNPVPYPLPGRVSALGDADSLSMLRSVYDSDTAKDASQSLAVEMSRLGFETRTDIHGRVIMKAGSGPVHAVLLAEASGCGGAPLVAFLSAASRLAARRHEMFRFTVVADTDLDGNSEVPDDADVCIVGDSGGWQAMTLGGQGSLHCRIRLPGHARDIIKSDEDPGLLTWHEIREATEEFNEGRDRAFDRLVPEVVGSGLEGPVGSEELVIELCLRLPLDLSPFLAENWLREVASRGRFELLAASPAWSSRVDDGVPGAFDRAIRDLGGTPDRRLACSRPKTGIPRTPERCSTLAYGPVGPEKCPSGPVGFLKGISVLERALGSSADTQARQKSRSLR